jgi:hypothetical protein
MKKPKFGKKGFVHHIFSRQLYRDFLKAHPEYKEKSWKEVKDTWENITEEFREQIAKNPLGVKMKYYIGELKFQYLPYKFKVKTNNGGEMVKEMNLHTRDKVGILKWERRAAVRYNKWLQYFAFDACSKLRIKAKEMIDENSDAVRISRVTTGRRAKK